MQVGWVEWKTCAFAPCHSGPIMNTGDFPYAQSMPHGSRRGAGLRASIAFGELGASGRGDARS